MGGVARQGESVAPNQYRLWDIDRNAGVPDNATDDKAFLDRLVLNAHVTKRSYLSAAWESTRISQQVCAAALAPAVFVRLRDGRMVAADLMALNATLVALASATLLVVSPQALSSQAILQAARQGGLLLVGLYNMAPLYQTLTRPISSDTIVAASVVLSLVHLYLHDYAFERSITEGLAGSLSVGAAVATAVLLASRLNASDEVFPYLTFALGTYILSPYFRRTVMHASASGHLLCTLLMACSAIAILWSINGILACAFCAALAFISAVCPWILVSVEKHKTQINGPWDEAKITTRVS